jgi:hypothetical protein
MKHVVKMTLISCKKNDELVQSSKGEKESRSPWYLKRIQPRESFYTSTEKIT